MSFFFKFIQNQWFTSIPYPNQELTGQTFIVTGANVGLGLEAARHLVRLKAEKVIIAVRSLEKGEAAKKSIEATTGRRNVIEVWQLDLSSYESVKQFAQRVQGLKRLDAIVENAGIATTEYRTFEDNESTITVNVVSTFLLAMLILPKLEESARNFNITPRLVIVSSDVHTWTTLPERKSANIFETLNSKKTADMKNRYDFNRIGVAD